MSEQCQLRWESLRVSRRLSGQGDINLNEYTCECDSGFELKSTARVALYQLPSTMLGTCSRIPLSPRKLSPMSVMCSACRVSSVTVESRREICRTTSGARPREHFAIRATRSQRTPSTDRQHQFEQKALHQQSAALRGAREVDGQNTGVGLHAGTVLVTHAG